MRSFLEKRIVQRYITQKPRLQACKDLKTIMLRLTNTNEKNSIPNTTNTLEGGTFSPMKNKINIHSGMDKKLKLKMVDDYLLNLKKK